MREQTTLPDLREPLEQLFAALGRPFGSTAAAATMSYWKAIKDLPSADVRRAIEYAIRDEAKRPPPSAIRAKAIAIGRAAHQAHSSPTLQGDRCPDCRALWYYAGYQLAGGAVAPRFRCDCAHHDRHAGWHTPAARAWVERDPVARSAMDAGELGTPPSMRRRGAA